MRKLLVALMVMVTGLTHGQIMLPGYQAVQYKGPSVPVLTTTAASTITEKDAVSGGNITLQGASAVTARGVCWGTSPNPVIGSANQTTDGTGIGNFTSNITGLELATTYYVRAYATNTAGTGYGNQISFTTLAAPPYEWGQSRDGGTVVYILSRGEPGYDANTQHGLIATVSTPGVTYAWANPAQNITGTSDALGSGLANTMAIYNAIGTSQASYAARYCYELVTGGKDDWYLPSDTELLYVAGFSSYLPPADNATVGQFWTSTMATSTEARYVNFGSRSSTLLSQTRTLRVIAVRSF